MEVHMTFSTGHVRTLLAATTLAAAAVAVPPAAAACAGVRAAGRWTTIDYPAMPDLTTAPHKAFNPSYIRTYSANGTTRREVLVSDGTLVYRTADGGCTWAKVFDTSVLSSTDPGADAWTQVARAHVGYGITDVGAGRSRLTMLALQNEGSPVWGLDRDSTPVLIATTTDAGRTWRTTPMQAACLAPGAPAHPINSINQLAVVDDTHAYAIVQLVDSYILHTADAGRTWACAPSPIKYIWNWATNRLRPTELWAASCDGVRRSTNGAASWALRGRPWAALMKDGKADCEIGAIDVRAARSGATDVAVPVTICEQVASKNCSRHVYVTTNAGASWTDLPSPITRPDWERLVAVQFGAARGSLLAFVGVGVQSISPASGHVVRAVLPGGKRWVDRGGMTEMVNRGCAHPALSSVSAFRPTDAARTEFLADAEVYYGNDGCHALVRYKAAG
jgi:photosystem II stability/assembly factor-like uncharacterized protein